MSKKSKIFDTALSNFVTDFASGGAVRHLADQGYTVREIVDQLDYPTPKASVAAMVWQHYIDTGKIMLTSPEKSNQMKKISYVKEYGKYGTTTMRRIEELVDLPSREYCLCEFGRMLYQNREQTERKLAALSPPDREYVLDLPWPLSPVYHIMDERIRRILEVFE